MLTMTYTLFSDLPLSAVLLGLTLVIFLSYHFVIYPALISPLARLPNAHWSAPFSPAWILYQRFKKRENASLEKAHKSLGPFIRVGPNDVSVNDLDAVRTIYQGGWEKPGWYGVFDNYGYVFRYRPHITLRQNVTDSVLQSALYVFGSQVSRSLAAETHDLERVLQIIHSVVPRRRGPSQDYRMGQNDAGYRGLAE